MRARLNRKRIEELRVRKAVLKAELAEAAGIHVNTLSAVLRGEPVGVIVLRKLAGALGVIPEELIKNVVDDQSERADPAGVGAA